MKKVVEIEKAVCALSNEGLAEFRRWFAEYDAEVGDRQLEEDISSGSFDELAKEAINEFRRGRCQEL